jgi:hypothetical protein
VEAECTFNILLPILKFKYPEADIEKCFTQETFDRCDSLTFDPSKGIVVDNLINNHLTFIDEENLLGFAYDTNEVDKDNSAPVA